ncbi:tautomerase family protein [Clostridium sp. WILCCON 0269]|uniref:Tautomerase family protein n=1 Tax=Candidatus Clostridium eludens TaxID=3381663 RepID=A0ABW8STN1_9CLOT
MPLVKIEIFKGKTAEYKKAIMDGVHSALVQAFKIPDDDRMQRLYELDKENFEVTPAKTDQCTLIEITAFKGRSIEAKRKLYREIVTNLRANPGIDGNDIAIVINEPPLENWGVRGGKPANEVNLGFKIEV